MCKYISWTKIEIKPWRTFPKEGPFRYLQYLSAFGFQSMTSARLKSVNFSLRSCAFVNSHWVNCTSSWTITPPSYRRRPFQPNVSPFCLSFWVCVCGKFCLVCMCSHARELHFYFYFTDVTAIKRHWRLAWMDWISSRCLCWNTPKIRF